MPEELIPRHATSVIGEPGNELDYGPFFRIICIELRKIAIELKLLRTELTA